MAMVFFMSACSKTTVIKEKDDTPSKPMAPLSTLNGGNGNTGTSDGGGGEGISCDSSVKNPQLRNKLFVRDIYEAIADHKLNLTNIQTPPNGVVTHDVAINFLVKLLNNYFGPGQLKLEFSNSDFWKQFESKISFHGDDTPLTPRMDANSPIQLPDGCRIVQIASWNDIDGEGTLYMTQSLWNKLDELNKIALLAHEYFFKRARENGAQNSDLVRAKIGQLFSANNPKANPNSWSGVEDKQYSSILSKDRLGYKVCSGSSKEDPKSKLVYYQYQGADGLQHINIPVIKSSTINVDYFQDLEYKFDPKNNFSLAYRTNLFFLPGRFGSLSSNASLSNLGLFLKKDIADANSFSDEIFNSLLYSQDVTALQQRFFLQKGSAVLTIKYPKFSDSNSTDTERASAEDLIRGLLADILAGNSSYDGKNLVLELDDEINDLITNKKDLDDFDELPKWQNILEKMSITKKLRVTKEYQEDLSLDLSDELPLLLYRAKTHTLSSEDFKRLILIKKEVAAAFTKLDQSAASIAASSISIAQGSEQLTFQLSCSTYEDAYVPLKNETYVIKKTNPSIELTVDEKNPVIEKIVGDFSVRRTSLIFDNLLKPLEDLCNTEGKCDAMLNLLTTTSTIGQYIKFIKTSDKIIISSCSAIALPEKPSITGDQPICLLITNAVDDVAFAFEPELMEKVTLIPFYKSYISTPRKFFPDKSDDSSSQ
jgi:hypothetical protein